MCPDHARSRPAAIANRRPTTSSPTGERLIELAVRVIHSCDHAGISVINRQKIRTVAASDNLVATGDQRQFLLSEGPCLDSVRHDTLRAPRLSNDLRWPVWAPWASQQLGVNSMLCLHLFTSDQSYGALTLYSDRQSGFDDHDLAYGRALATHAAVTMAGDLNLQALSTTLRSRTVIGQAQGILMERLDISADEALAMLREESQNNDAIISVLAEDLIKTRRIPTA
jgi:GAF domain-containing protein